MLPAIHLPATAPVDGFFDRFDKDFQKNKKEFPLLAEDWRIYVKAIREVRVSWIREGLSSLYHSVSPDDYLFDVELYFRGKLTSLVDVAQYYFQNEKNQRERERRERLYRRMLTWRREYESRKKKAEQKEQVSKDVTWSWQR